MRLRPIVLAGSAAMALAAAAPTFAAPGIGVEAAFPRLRFDRPLDLQAPGDGSNSLVVVEQAGVVRRFINSPAALSSTVFLDIRSRVKAEGNEEGLLGLAFDPNFKTSRTFYVNYTAARPSRTVISRFRTLAAKPDQADPASEQVVLQFLQPYANHNGGCLQFGPDGYMYIGTGDGGAGGDPHDNGQNRSTLLGKMLRIDVRQPGRTYKVPPDNPLVGKPGARPEIWAWGLRNPWRFSFDRDTGLLYCGDVGQNRLEEVDVIEKGKNYGWRLMEGSQCFKPNTCDRTGLSLPIAEYGRELGQSITGGRVYRGNRVPGLRGAYLYADFASGRIWQLRYEAGRTRDQRLLLETGLNISSFGEDARRELYFTSFDGQVYKFKP